MSENGVHAQYVAGTQTPRANGPSCPWCGAHGDSKVVNHPHGKYLCGCGSLHNGTDAEWRLLAQHRREATERHIREAAHHEEEAS